VSRPASAGANRGLTDPTSDVAPDLGSRRSAARLGAYASAALLVRLADEGARVALTLLALERTGDATTGGVLVAALLAPHVVAAPVVGLLADRMRRPERLTALAALGFAASLAGSATALGGAPLACVLALLLLGGCCGSALTGVLSSQLPRLVGPARLPRAFGVDALTYNVAGILGPAAAALLASRVSPSGGALALSGGAAIGAGILAVLPLCPGRAGAERALRSDLLAGIGAIGRDRVLATATAATCAAQIGAGSLPVVAVVLAEHRYGPAWAGGLLTAVAAGGLLGSLAWTWRPAPPSRAHRVVLLGLVAMGLPLAAAAGTSSLVLVVALFALSGLCQGPVFGALLLTREHHAPQQLRGQVFSVGAGAKVTATAAGAALAGAASGLPVGTQLVLAGAWPVLAGGVGLAVLGLRSPGR